MGAPIINIDLHGMFRDDAVKAIDLKDMIAEEYRYHPKVLRVQPGDNLGTTVLVLREL